MNACNGHLFGESSKLKIELFRLQNGPLTHANIDLMTAATALNFNEYEKYKQKQLRANEELSMTHDNDDLFESITVITSVRYLMLLRGFFIMMKTDVIVSNE